MAPTDLETPLAGQTRPANQKSFLHVLKSYVPILEWLPAYQARRFLLDDIAGGITLGCILMGQSLAHADLCKVSLIHGPYSCMLPPIFYSLFGTCVHASVGTGGLVSLLTGEQLANYGDDVEYRTRVGALLTLQVGLIMFLMGVCRLAFLVRFLSRPALSGFITASAILIILSQLPPMIGLPKGATGGIVDICLYKTRALTELSVPTLLLSCCILGFLMNAKRMKSIPVLKYVAQFKELFLLFVTLLFTRSFNARVKTEGDKINVVGAMPSGLPQISSPLNREVASLWWELFPAATLVALVVFLSSFAGAKKFAMKDGYQIKPFNELLALGIANMAGSVTAAVPTQIGLSRMGIAHQAGIKSQIGANICTAMVVAGITSVASSYLYNVPKCALNCIIVNGASHLTEFDEVVELWKLAKNPKYNWKCRMDVVVWIAGFACTLYFGAFTGILMAVVLSLCLILYQVVNPELTELGFKVSTQISADRARKWIGCTRDDAVVEAGILVYRIEGPLFYANVESMQEWLEEREVQHFDAEGETYKGIILSAASVSFVDTTAIRALEDMIKTYAQRGILFFIANSVGSAGRMFTDNLEPLEELALKSKSFKEQVAKSSTIDDFVQLIKDHAADSSKRRSLVVRCKSRPFEGAGRRGTM